MEEMRKKKKEKKKKGKALPLAISDESAVETCRGKRQSWSMRRELCMGTRKCGFRRVPKGMGFSYTGYFLPSGHIRVILVQL